jgi:hypothetical protein
MIFLDSYPCRIFPFILFFFAAITANAAHAIMATNDKSSAWLGNSGIVGDDEGTGGEG